MNKKKTITKIARLFLWTVLSSHTLMAEAQSLNVTATESKGVMAGNVFNVLENTTMKLKYSFESKNDSVTKVKSAEYDFAGAKGTITTSVLGGKVDLYDVTLKTGTASSATKAINSSMEYYTGDSVSVQINDSTWEKRWDAENKLHSVSSNVIDVLVWTTPESKFNGDVSISRDGIAEGLSWDVVNKGGYDKGWVVKWTYDGKTYDGNKFNMPTYINTTGTRQYLTIGLEAINYAPDGMTEWSRLNKTITVSVSSVPTVIVDTPVVDGYSGHKATASVSTYAAPDNSEWTFEWTFNGTTVTTKEPVYTFTMPVCEDGGSWSGKLHLLTKNSKSSMVVNNDVDIVVNSFSTGSSSVATLDTLNINSNSSITLKAIPFGGKPSGWTYEWKDNSKTIATGTSSNYTFSPKNSSGKTETHVYSVVAKNAINGIVGYEEELYFESITLWPTCDVPNAIRLIDKNNVNNNTYCVREGNEYVVDIKGYKGGYAIDGEEQWAESWYNDGKFLDNTSPLLKAEIKSTGDKQSVQTQNVDVVLTNRGPYKNFWFNKRLSQVITLYKRPATPTSLKIKGSASRILVATMPISDNVVSDCEYYLVFGSTGHPEHIVEQAGRTEKYYQFPSSEFNSNNDFYVYSLWKYADGAIVTSGKRFLNKTDENWDGSDFSKSLGTRGIGSETETTDITEVEDSDTFSTEIFDVRGNKVEAMQKGLYIIKYSDGTVRKVYKSK